MNYQTLEQAVSCMRRACGDFVQAPLMKKFNIDLAMVDPPFPKGTECLWNDCAEFDNSQPSSGAGKATWPGGERPFDHGAWPIDDPVTAARKVDTIHVVIAATKMAQRAGRFAESEQGQHAADILDEGIDRVSRRALETALENQRDAEDMQRRLDITANKQEQRDRVLDAHGVDASEMNGFSGQHDDGSFELDTRNLPDVENMS